MRVLFIVQGEGRGHLTQAISLERMLRRNGHEVVEVLVGESSSRQLPEFFYKKISAPIRRFTSPNFLPKPANKRVSISRSAAYNILRIPTYMHSVGFIRSRINESGADLVVNFYELLTGLAYLLFRPSVPQVSIGHQYLFLHHDFQFPDKSHVSLWLLRMFTRVTCIGAADKLALSFREMPDDEDASVSVMPPLLRREILETESHDGDYLHGYMVNAGYGEDIVSWHRSHPIVPLHFFWDKKDRPKECKVDDTLTFHQIDDTSFLAYMSGCKAYATTGGFESVCEAMYLGKPLLMVPVHIEQDCNAYDAALGGAGIVSEDFNLGRLMEFAEGYHPDITFRQWADCCECRMMSHLERVAAEVELPATGLGIRGVGRRLIHAIVS